MPELLEQLLRLERDAPQIGVDHPHQLRAEPWSARELHPVRDLVDRDPQPEVLRRQLRRALDIDQVRPHEVDQPVVVGRQEHVDLPEHPTRHVAEEPADLHTEGFACHRALVAHRRRALLRDPAGERLDRALQALEVLSRPIAAAHHPRARSKPADGDAGELGDERFRLLDVTGQLLAHLGSLGVRHLRAGAGDRPCGANGGVPIGEPGRL